MKKNNEYIDFASLLDYVEGNLPARKKRQVERYLAEQPVDQAAVQGIRLMYEQEEMSREDLEAFLAESFPEIAISRGNPGGSGLIHQLKPHGMLLIKQIISVAAVVCLCFFINTLKAELNESPITLSDEIRGPYELCYGLKQAH